jgi:hypothetical protein
MFYAHDIPIFSRRPYPFLIQVINQVMTMLTPAQWTCFLENPRKDADEDHMRGKYPTLSKFFPLLAKVFQI